MGRQRRELDQAGDNPISFGTPEVAAKHCHLRFANDNPPDM
jgi:hypothetical protein